MKIGFEAKKAVSNFTGIGNYSRRCINALQMPGYENIESVLFVPGKIIPCAFHAIQKDVRIAMPDKWIRRNGFLREVWRCLFSWHTIRRESIDVYHGLSNELPFFIRHAGCKTIVTIHDLIFIRQPETYDRFSRAILKAKTLYACHAADHIIAVSERTKQDIIKFYGINEEKISVAYQSISDIFRQPLSYANMAYCRKQLGLPEEYILCVGSIQTRKNQKSIVKALPLIQENLHVVLIGKRTNYQDEITATAASLGVSHRLHIINNLANEYLPAVYQGATAFVLLSVFEGFGIPVAEALASGVPVIAARGSCLGEAGGPDSIYIDPYDTEGLANAIRRICNDKDLRETMIRRGIHYSRLFTDKHLATDLIRIYNKVINKKDKKQQ